MRPSKNDFGFEEEFDGAGEPKEESASVFLDFAGESRGLEVLALIAEYAWLGAIEGAEWGSSSCDTYESVLGR